MRRVRLATVRALLDVRAARVARTRRRSELPPHAIVWHRPQRRTQCACQTWQGWAP